MDAARRKKQLEGCYITVPTMFKDDDQYTLDVDATRRSVRFWIDNGIDAGADARPQRGHLLTPIDIGYLGSAGYPFFPYRF